MLGKRGGRWWRREVAGLDDNMNMARKQKGWEKKVAALPQLSALGEKRSQPLPFDEGRPDQFAASAPKTLVVKVWRVACYAGVH